VNDVLWSIAYFQKLKCKDGSLRFSKAGIYGTAAANKILAFEKQKFLNKHEFILWHGFRH
jgi:hypothetical protein